MTENRFNLIDEPWIPVVDVGRVSLKGIFSNPNLKALGGNPVQKIALTKLLLAIAQSAHTPEDDQAWLNLGANGLAKACLTYLEKWHDRFYLYGEKPFLQMPEIVKAAVQTYGAVLPEIATGNTTVHTQIQQEKILDDADKALLVLQLMGFGLGGKADNSIVLSQGYTGKLNPKGKPSVAVTGSWFGKKGKDDLGLLHSFVIGTTLIKTVWMNLFSKEQIEQIKVFEKGIGVAPWESMPTGEDDDLAKNLKYSYMGRLIPVNWFVLLKELDGIHCSEGVAHEGYQSGVYDPSIAVRFTNDKSDALLTDPEKRPWRELTSLLSFIEQDSNNAFSYDCLQLKFCLARGLHSEKNAGVWSGGLRASINSGKFFLSGSDDFVESNVFLTQESVNSYWYENLSIEMKNLDEIASWLYSGVKKYFELQKVEFKKKGANPALQAKFLFWQLCESRFQELILKCEKEHEEERIALRKVFAGFVNQAFENYCPKETARQLDAWAQAQPNLSKYLAQPNKEVA